MDGLHRHWAEYGPPVHISLAAFAGGWGMKLTTSRPSAAPNISTDPLQGLGDLPVVKIQRPRMGLPTGGASG